MSNWQDINTAPKEPDCYSDLPGDANEGVGIATNSDTGEIEYLLWWKNTGNGGSTTTYWMPLPAPPKETAR